MLMAVVVEVVRRYPVRDKTDSRGEEAIAAVLLAGHFAVEVAVEVPAGQK